jgi:hypothetical protein
VNKAQHLEREKAVLTRQLQTLSGRLQAGDRTVRAQISAVNRQLARIAEQLEGPNAEEGPDTPSGKAG